ncbi:MAG: hypothetical protein HYS25_01235 [Ignavibacteriales bacterium]|nr:hypothetical protein [Ignavibacteriales bacterium]
MKTIKYILIASTLFMLFRCTNPSPTELIQDNTAVNENLQQIEVVSPDPDTYVYSNGYDSTGIVEPYLNKSSVISLSGIKYSNFDDGSQADYYYAVFNDKSMPILNTMGTRLGFWARMMGGVRFNNVVASPMQNRIRYLQNGEVHDTVIGYRFVLTRKMMHSHNKFEFPYNSKLNVRVDESRNSFFQIDVPTPAEISGEVNASGSPSRNNLTLNLKWNGTNQGIIEIVIGVLEDSGNEIFPLLKLTGADNGKMKISSSILEKLPDRVYKKLVITFIRRQTKEIPENSILKDSYIVSQSIHNIKVEIPD